MAGGNLHGLNVARLAIDGFEQVELTQPRQALEDAKPERFDALVLQRGEWWGRLRNIARPHKKHRDLSLW